MKKRESNIELLRVLSAVLITLNHVPISQNPLHANYLLQRFFFLGGQTGVNLYVIIGAWFLAGKQFTFKRVIKLVEQTVFYALVLDVVSVLLDTRLSVSMILKSFNYWFCLGYAAMLLMKPMLDKIKGKAQLTVVICGLAVSIGVTVLGYLMPSAALVRLFLKGAFIGPVWFCYVYVLMSFIKERKDMLHLSWQKCLGVFIVGYCTMYFTLLLTHNSSIREVHSPICLLCALTLFFCFVNMNIGYVPLVNKMATYTFGVYLLQSHQVFRIYVWEKVIHFQLLSEQSITYGLFTVLVILIIFVLSMLIDLLRTKLETLRFVGKLENAVCQRVDKIILKDYEEVKKE